MRVRRLGWAGLEIEADGSVAVVDLLEDLGWLTEFVGEPREPLPPPENAGAVDVALVTHLHGDHADPAAIARALGPDGVLLRPEPARGEGLETIANEPAERALAKLDVPARVVVPWETVEIGAFALTAVAAVDGLGEPQVSWVIAAGGRRILHAGDTIYHGSWWLTAMRHKMPVRRRLPPGQRRRRRLPQPPAQEPAPGVDGPGPGRRGRPSARRRGGRPDPLRHDVQGADLHPGR